MGTADQLIALEDSWVGTAESPAHSNRTWIGEAFGWNGVAWCAETQSLALKRTGTPGFWTASVAQAISDAKAGHNGLTWVPRNGIIRKGDMSCFDWGGQGNSSDFHISCVRDPGTQTRFQTDGGNENDALRQQWRDRTYIQGFIRPAYSDPVPPSPTPPPQEEDDMPIAFVETINPGESKFIAVPPCNWGGAGWGQVWGSIGVDAYGVPPVDCRVMIKGLGGDPNTNWRAPTGADKDIVHCNSGRGTAPGQGWAFAKGDEGVTIENRGKHPVTFLCEAVKA